MHHDPHSTRTFGGASRLSAASRRCSRVAADSARVALAGLLRATPNPVHIHVVSKYIMDVRRSDTQQRRLQVWPMIRGIGPEQVAPNAPHEKTVAPTSPLS